MQGAKSITTFEILPQPPPSRAQDNPWPTFPRVFKVDYGHEEVKVKWGKDPREYSTTTKVCLIAYLILNLLIRFWQKKSNIANHIRRITLSA